MGVKGGFNLDDLQMKAAPAPVPLASLISGADYAKKPQIESKMVSSLSGLN